VTDTEVIAEVMAEVVKAALAPLVTKCVALEAQIQALEARAPVPGPAGETGPAGRDGIDGKDGADAMLPELPDLELLAVRAAELVPRAKDGVDGRDGMNGQDGRDGQPGVPGVPGRDGSPGERGEKGLDGKDGAPGRDGTLDALRVEQLDERRWRFVRSDGTPMPGDPIYLPMMVYKNVFVEGMAYDKGDAVTFGGSLWIARETTKNKPGDGSTAWQLAAKEGRRGSQGLPGKDGAPGPKGERGDPGRNFS
jgi:Collagen triple helix repeat (20 copies)